MTGSAALGLCAAAAVALLLPLIVLAVRSVTTADGFTLAHYSAYLSTPGLLRALGNTAVLGIATVVVVVPLAFAFAYGLQRAVLPGKRALAVIAMAPLLVPSLLPALVLIYLFGRQGLLNALLQGGGIYGFPGVLLADAIATFPHALVDLRLLDIGNGRGGGGQFSARKGAEPIQRTNVEVAGDAALCAGAVEQHSGLRLDGAAQNIERRLQVRIVKQRIGKDQFTRIDAQNVGQKSLQRGFGDAENPGRDIDPGQRILRLTGTANAGERHQVVGF